VAQAPSVPIDAPVDSRARLQTMFDRHHNLVWRTLRRYGLDAEAAAAVGQLAYLVAIERIDDIWLGSERAFLLGTALRLARKPRRSVARAAMDAIADEPARPAASAESHAMTLELLDRVLGQLDASLVEVFVLFDVEGFSTREIATALAIPEGTVASRLRRAREEFRAVTHRLSCVLDREEGGR
jgi:RNA polymerase sigma-70 factor (ECF subfamily)